PHLEHRPHALAGARVARVAAEHGDGAAGGRAEAEEEAHGGRLPRAVRPEQRGDAPRREVEVERVERGHAAQGLARPPERREAGGRDHRNLTSSRASRNGRGGGPPAMNTAITPRPSLPPNAASGNAYSFHSAPATNGCTSGTKPRLSTNRLTRYV